MNYLGIFDTPEEAAQAYLEQQQKEHGQLIIILYDMITAYHSGTLLGLQFHCP